jgi:exonuclease SbcC
MIHSLHLKNFESHRNTNLIFSKGINIISGQSDHGKSSIIRGLYWIKDNQPSGSSMISFWNRDKKGNPKKATFSEIEINGQTITRIKSTEGVKNGYLLGDNKLDAIGQKVPEEITSALNLSDINIQYQFDRPFLLDDSPLEVARFFNRTIRLDQIDRVLSKASTMRKRLNAEIKSLEFNIDTANAQIKKYDWIETVCPLIEDLEYKEFFISEKGNKIEKVKGLIADYKANQEQIEHYSAIVKCSKITERCDKLIESIKQRKAHLAYVSDLVNEYKKQQESIKNYKKIIKYQKLIDKIDSLQTIIKEKREKIAMIERLVSDYKDNITIIEEKQTQIKKLQKTLPKLCPTCGKPL